MCIFMYREFPKLGVPFWGVPAIRTVVFWGLNWGPPILGKYRMVLRSYIRPSGAVLHIQYIYVLSSVLIVPYSVI